MEVEQRKQALERGITTDDIEKCFATLQCPKAAVADGIVKGFVKFGGELHGRNNEIVVL